MCLIERERERERVTFNTCLLNEDRGLSLSEIKDQENVGLVGSILSIA